MLLQIKNNSIMKNGERERDQKFGCFNLYIHIITGEMGLPPRDNVSNT